MIKIPTRGTKYTMAPSKSSTESKGVKLNIKPYQQIRSQTQHCHIIPTFTPRPNLPGACETMMDQTFLGKILDNFKAALDNIEIYVRAN